MSLQLTLCHGLNLVVGPAVVLGGFLAFTKLDILLSLFRCVASGKQLLDMACNTCWRGLKSSLICRERRYCLCSLTSWTGRCESNHRRYSVRVMAILWIDLACWSWNKHPVILNRNSHYYCPSCSVICKYEFQVCMFQQDSKYLSSYKKM
jgi:hypothetical protein